MVAFFGRLNGLRALLAALLVSATVRAKFVEPPVPSGDLLVPALSSYFYSNQRLALEEQTLDYRLPNETTPNSYSVELWTDVHTGKQDFKGEVIIDLSVLTRTKSIVLHARQLKDFEGAIAKKNDQTGAVAADEPVEFSYEETREFLTVKPKNTKTVFEPRTNWNLRIKYAGALRTDNGGFYLSKYVDEANVTHFLATTQFESTDARHAFPCYDEPSKRANFVIAIHHSPTYSAISNMPVDEALTDATTGLTVFQQTPKMSPYLLAFIVSDFEYTEGSLNGPHQRVFTRRGGKAKQEQSLMSGILLEESLARYYDVPFALPKLDQAGLPDFAAGAMENWGLATYREQYMQYNRDTSTMQAKTQIANIIGHEYAHMWFGDLVSIEWWTYLWLKEGFATIFSYISDNDVYPEWDIYQLFQPGEYNTALLADEAGSLPPMTHYVQTPKEIKTRYDSISYSKASCVLHMFQNAWTDEVFRLGLHKYLSTNQYTSANELQLFAALQAAADEKGFKLPKPVAEIFGSWSRKRSFPVLTVERDYKSGGFKVSQEAASAANTTWYVPFNYAYSSASDYRDTRATNYLLNEREISLKDAGIPSDDWLLLNKQSTGLYRVNYDEQNWRLIAKGLQEKPYKVHPRNRAQLLLDAQRFVFTGRLPHSVLLDLLSYLVKEDQYAPWAAAYNIFLTLDRFLAAEPQAALYRQFGAEMVAAIFDKLGVDESTGEPHLNKYLRNTLTSLACLMGDTNCLNLTNAKLRQYVFGGQRVEPSSEDQMYCSGLRKADDELFQKMLSAVTKSASGTVKRTMYISSMGCAQNQAQLKQFVESSTDLSNRLSLTERTSLLRSAYTRGQVGVDVCLEFLEKNWSAYGKLGNRDAYYLDAAIRDMSNYIISETDKTRLNNLVAQIEKTEFAKSDLAKDVQGHIAANFEWLAKHRKPLMTFFTNYAGNAGTRSAAVTQVLVIAFSMVLILMSFRL